MPAWKNIRAWMEYVEARRVSEGAAAAQSLERRAANRYDEAR